MSQNPDIGTKQNPDFTPHSYQLRLGYIYIYIYIYNLQIGLLNLFEGQNALIREKGILL